MTPATIIFIIAIVAVIILAFVICKRAHDEEYKYRNRFYHNDDWDYGCG